MTCACAGKLHLKTVLENFQFLLSRLYKAYSEAWTGVREIYKDGGVKVHTQWIIATDSAHIV